jgi:hypothetical protein
MKILVTHPELKSLLPSLSESERQGLEADILKHGCLSPIATWGNFIVDGHARYEICVKHGLPYETRGMPFKSLDEAMLWAWQNQEHRRNLTPYQRVELALRFKPEIAAKAKNNQEMTRRKQHDELIPIDTKMELTKIANVSTGTLYKAEYLSNHADDETKENLRRGNTTINREYTRLKEVAKPMLPQPPLIHPRKMTSCPVVPENAKELVEYIVDRFEVKEVERLIIDLLDQLRQIKTKATFKVFLKKLFAKHFQ